VKGCQPLSQTEISAIVDTLDNARDRALVILGIRTGFRVSELLSLRLGDVFNRGAVVSAVSVARANMKKKVEGRTVPLHQEAKAALEAWCLCLISEGATAETYLFLSREGGNRPISRVQAYRIIKAAAETNGIDGRIGTHSMRKTFANTVYDRLNGDLPKVQRAMGHKNINSTVSYLSFKQEEIDAAILA